MQMKGGWERYLDEGIGPVLHVYSLDLGMAHSKALARFPVPLPSGVALDEASVIVRQKWQVEAVRHGVFHGGMQKEGQEGEGRRRKGREQASTLGAKVLWR